MKLTRTLATLCTAATAAVVLSAGTATADDDLLSALNNPAIGAACLPSGQAGVGNTVTGTQNVNCSQSAQQSTSGSGGGLTGYEVVSRTNECIAGATCGITLRCPDGKKVTGGGVYVNPQGPDTHVVSSGTVPGEDNTRWDGVIQNDSAGSVDFTVQAICADATP
ncbi:hypothetical protein [Streptomyces lavendulae]|uniref:hypothetical protein n=1 Tax=Streptomyces lavendulae TaxID=1914 RepID=UPI0024A60325|nr:hypothetical protein [Streptomyces lavendulae]GLX23353.1 hypothetical protein Slala01_69970 [Streptomyces lavendulae subsp. lavendulae]GLX31351.1 hypothetical protein Slala02_71700 [Streptomyces lavendulae subsp. lavendulae]